MNRFTIFASLIVGLALALACPATRAADPKLDSMARERCIKACHECLGACRECVVCGDCPDCVRTCLTCIEACRTCVALMEFDSPLAKRMCVLCEEACRCCAEECAKCGDLEHTKKCADACRKCQEACKALAM